MNKKLRGIALCLVIALTAALSACGGGNNDASPQASQKASPKASAAASPQEDITLKFISWWSYVTPDILKKFEEENPGIKIDYEYVAPGDGYTNKIKSLSASGDLPDVFAAQHPNLSPLVKSDQILDLKSDFDTPAYDKDTAWKDTINPVLIENMNGGFEKDSDAANHVWAVPFGAISVAVIYNKTLFDKSGLQAPTTWEQFEANNAVLQKSGVIPMSYTNKVGWGDWWFRLLIDQTARDVKPDDFVTGKVKISDPGFVEALQKLKDMWTNQVFDPNGLVNGIDESQALFVQQKLAQYIVVPENFVKYLTDNKPAGVELGAYVLPAWKGINPSRTLGGAANLVVVSSATKHKEAAVKLTKFLTSEKVFQMLSKEDVVPSTKGYTPPEGDAIMGAYAAAAENGFIVDHLPAGQDAQNKLFKDVIPQVLIGKLAPEAGLKQVQAIIDKSNGK
ncbi:extracellular solute-binding protein [Cohnella endophytica]|uniref:Extracellular solute-binding protein n=1 Tax=Cohnella endophytica TaxID=2419778 RepID=A0A494XV67_9BACL|nr:extracellular solute-binding protein [Cohnella endophytica]RKP54458.1 extracellular solute-binding protein [Cohnella endophytica]